MQGLWQRKELETREETDMEGGESFFFPTTMWEHGVCVWLCLWPVPRNVSDRGWFLFPLLLFFPCLVCGSGDGKGREGKGNAFPCAFLIGSWIPGGLWLGRDLKIMGIGGDG